MNQIRYDPPRAVALAVLALVVVAAALLRFPSLGEQGLWRDEAATWLQVNGSLGEVISRTATDNYPPLYNLLAWASVQLFGGAEWVLRLPSAALGVLNVALLYGLGARIGGRGVGLVAAALLALSGYHVWYSQEARMYALLACTATAHAWAMVHFLDRPRAARALLLGLSGIPLIYAHPYGALTWIGIGFGALYTIVLRRDWPALLSLVLAETNNELENPLWHGEVHTLKRFYQLGERPDTRDLVFLSTHEPCPMCMAAITWAGFDNFYYFFSYEDSRDSFAIPHDLRILKEVFGLEPGGYHKNNAFWNSFSIRDLVVAGPRRAELEAQSIRIRGEYDRLSTIYQASKADNAIPLN